MSVGTAVPRERRTAEAVSDESRRIDALKLGAGRNLSSQVVERHIQVAQETHARHARRDFS